MKKIHSKDRIIFCEKFGYITEKICYNCELKECKECKSEKVA
jgi:hypothetical protein